MSQLNLHVTAQFEKNLRKFMRIRKIATKSEAIRAAVRECLERVLRETSHQDFRSWIGAGQRVPENPDPHFPNDDALWN